MTELVTARAAEALDERAAAALAAARAGDILTVDDVEALLRVPPADLGPLLAAASSLRDAGLAAAGRPGVITYSRKVFVPLTTLCRDRCHYCVFVDTPGQLLAKRKPVYMSVDQVLSVARQGAALGCKEALLTLGDRPEDRWPEARAWLDEHGFASTLDYVGHVARVITAETGLLAHLNPGLMSEDELRTLRPTAPSMGMMLETTSRRLFEEPGEVHHGSPDKDPALRLATIAAAGRVRVPFTTGILVGIGETLRDRAESLVALRDLQAEHGHLQEVIVQNFRAKPRTAMQHAPDATTWEYIATVAVARIVLGASMRVQVPPNLSDPQELGLLVRAGVDDWGGVSPLTADHVNPERPWPHLDDLAAQTAELGFTLRERLTAHPEYLADPDTWLDPAVAPAAGALADPDTHLARVEAGGAVARPVPAGATPRTVTSPGSARPTTVLALLERVSDPREPLDDREWESLLLATGRDLDALARTADDLRRYTVGEAVSLVVNRNVSSAAYRAAGSNGPTTYGPDELADIARDAWDLGATELCIQGTVAESEDPAAYVDIARIVKQATPRMHLHAFRPQDVADFADRSGLGLDEAVATLRSAGVDTVPGTGVKVLSERVRGLVAPTDLAIARWVETITAAHRAGLTSSSVLFYGHVETAPERIAHLRTILQIHSETRGFTEFVPIPLPGHGVPLVPGRSVLDEHRAMTAVSRLMLSGAVAHVQTPWTRLGVDGAAAMLGAGADDLGGTLLDGRVLPAVGAEAGLELPVAEARRLAHHLFRPFRQRTTDYREPDPDRKVR